MSKLKTRSILVLLILVSAMGFSEEELPSLPEPEFEFMDQDASRSGSERGSAPDLLGELEGLLENPAQRDANAQLGIEKSSPLDNSSNDQIFVDPLPTAKIDPSDFKDEAPIPTLENREAKRSFVPMKRPQTSAKRRVSESSKTKRRVSSVSNSISKSAGGREARKGRSSLVVNNISEINFSRKEKYHEIEIRSEAPLSFKLKTQKKSRQLVYTFAGVSIPKKLRRAYDTREFNSPVAMYTLGRIKKRGKWLGQLVIQMRELVLPQVIEQGNAFILQFPDSVEKIIDRKIASQLPETSLGVEAFEGGRTYTGQRIEKLELKNTDIAEALKLVLQPSGYNVIMSEEVKGEVGNLSLSDTPWDQAFHLLLKMKGLGYVLRGNVLQIAPVAVLQQERELAERQEETEPLRTVMIPVSYAKAATLAPRAQAFLSKRGKVDTDERTNTIIIRDVDSVIKRIQKVFAVLDTQPPAVSISAKFVEVKKDFTRTLGLGAMSLTGQTSGINFGVPGAAVPGLEAGPGFTANPTGGSINLSAPKFAALQAKLTLGETENQVKVLANPTITVQQGQKGNITQGTTTEIPQTLVQGGQGAVAGALQQTANLTLDVTPIVANDGSISLDTNLLQENPLPAQVGVAKDTRNIKTQIILRNGDTAVLGGVFLGRDTETNTGVPFLRNLPLLGYLFSSRVNLTNRNEVLIFITARILNPESAFKQSL